MRSEITHKNSKAPPTADEGPGAAEGTAVKAKQSAVPWNS